MKAAIEEILLPSVQPLKVFANACKGFTCFACLLAPLHAKADTKSPSTVSYTLGTGENYRPFTDKSHPEGGMAVAVVKAAYKAIGVSANVTWTSWKRAESQAETGKMAAIFPYMTTSERAKKFVFSHPIYTMRSYFFVRAKDNFKSGSEDFLKGKRLCRPTGYGNEAAVQKLLDAGTITMISALTQESCFRLLSHNRADLVVESEVVAHETLSGLSGVKTDITHLPDAIASVDLGLMAAKDKKTGTEAIADFNRGLKKIQSDGTYRQILTKFGLP